MPTRSLTQPRRATCSGNLAGQRAGVAFPARSPVSLVSPRRLVLFERGNMARDRKWLRSRAAPNGLELHPVPHQPLGAHQWLSRTARVSRHHLRRASARIRAPPTRPMANSSTIRCASIQFFCRNCASSACRSCASRPAGWPVTTARGRLNKASARLDCHPQRANVVPLPSVPAPSRKSPAAPFLEPVCTRPSVLPPGEALSPGCIAKARRVDDQRGNHAANWGIHAECMSV